MELLKTLPGKNLAVIGSSLVLALSLFAGLKGYAQVQSSEPASPVNHAQLLRRASLSSSTMTQSLR